MLGSLLKAMQGRIYLGLSHAVKCPEVLAAASIAVLIVVIVVRV